MANRNNSNDQIIINIDDLLKQLDYINAGNIEIEQSPVRPQSQSKVGINKPIVTPELPDRVEGYSTRFEAFKKYIQNVPYDTTSPKDYVNGHKDALEKYYKEACNNPKDLYVVEAVAKNEKKKLQGYQQIYDRGFSDGIDYVIKALNASKRNIMAMINREVNTKL